MQSIFNLPNTWHYIATASPDGFSNRVRHVACLRQGHTRVPASVPCWPRLPRSMTRQPWSPASEKHPWNLIAAGAGVKTYRQHLFHRLPRGVAENKPARHPAAFERHSAKLDQWCAYSCMEPIGDIIEAQAASCAIFQFAACTAKSIASRQSRAAALCACVCVCDHVATCQRQDVALHASYYRPLAVYNV